MRLVLIALAVVCGGCVVARESGYAQKTETFDGVQPAWKTDLETYCDGWKPEELPANCREHVARKEQIRASFAAKLESQQSSPVGLCVAGAEFDYKECIRLDELDADECKSNFDVAAKVCESTQANATR
jgi:hypothetical protein